MQKPLPWPPQQGEIWVAMSAWFVNGHSMCISAGTHLLVATEPLLYSKVNDSWAMDVVWHGGRRRLVAAPKDLMPLDWLSTDTACLDTESARQREEEASR